MRYSRNQSKNWIRSQVCYLYTKSLRNSVAPYHLIPKNWDELISAILPFSVLPSFFLPLHFVFLFFLSFFFPSFFQPWAYIIPLFLMYFSFRYRGIEEMYYSVPYTHTLFPYGISMLYLGLVSSNNLNYSFRALWITNPYFDPTQISIC